MSRNSRKRNQQRKKGTKNKRPGARRQAQSTGPWVSGDDLLATAADLERPGDLKLRLATFAAHQQPGRSKLARFKTALVRGRLGNIRDVDHWAMEEFFYHGAPGDAWHPIEAYAALVAEHGGDEIVALLRSWKAAQIGCWRVEAVAGVYLTLRPWGIADARAIGAPLRAISIGLGGAQNFAQAIGQVLVGYLAAWPREGDTWCFMGYGMALPPRDAWLVAPLLALRQPELMIEPLPWEGSEPAFREHLRRWKQRDWQAWFAAGVELPFRAVVRSAGDRKIVDISGLTPMDEEIARRMGVYFEVGASAGPLELIGASNIEPLDVTSSNWLAFAEYGAYREEVGPPPGVPAGGPTVVLNRSGKVTWR